MCVAPFLRHSASFFLANNLILSHSLYGMFGILLARQLCLPVFTRLILVQVDPSTISDKHLFSASQTEAAFRGCSLAAEMAPGRQAFSELSRINKPSVTWGLHTAWFALQHSFRFIWFKCVSLCVSLYYLLYSNALRGIGRLVDREVCRLLIIR